MYDHPIMSRVDRVQRLKDAKREASEEVQRLQAEQKQETDMLESTVQHLNPRHA